MSTYKLFGAGTGGVENGVAQIDIQFDGTISSIHGSMISTVDADDEFASVEASFLATNTTAVNDARGSLITLQAQSSLVTSGFSINGVNSGVGPVDIPVNAGERIFLHINSSAGVVTSAQIYLYVLDGAPTSQRRRR